MIDTARIRVDLLDLIGRDTRLKRVASTHGGEWAGPCPFCGGTDRFRVWPEQGRWWCRRCGQAGDGIAYLMARERVDFREACRRLGAPSDRPVLLPRDTEPEPSAEPPGWAAGAGLQVVAECEAILWSDAGARARAWLQARGLEEATIREFRLGYQPADGDRRGLCLDRGIVIPTLAVDGALWGIAVRRPVGEPRYRQVRGSRHAMVGRLAGRADLLLAEAILDAALAWQEAQDIVDVATFGSCSVQPARRWLPYLARYPRWLLAYDVDRGGEEGAARWSWSPRARRVRLPLAQAEGKDITDFWRAGGNLRAWVQLCLASARAEVDVEPAPQDVGDEWEEGVL